MRFWCSWCTKCIFSADSVLSALLVLVVLNSYLGVKLRYKLSNEKQRFTFCPLVCSRHRLVCSGHRLDGWKPYVISKCQGSRWCDRKFEIERKTFHKNGEAFELTRRIFPDLWFIRMLKRGRINIFGNGRPKDLAFF